MEPPSFDGADPRDVRPGDAVAEERRDRALAPAGAWPNSSRDGRGRGRAFADGAFGGEEEDDDGARRPCDPAAAHVRTGWIRLPVEMTLPRGRSEVAAGGGGSDRNGGSDATTSPSLSSGPQGAEASAPSFSVNQARVSLYAAFPPPPVVVRPDDGPNGPMYDESDLTRAEDEIRRHFGFHPAVGVTSATSLSEGYSDTMLSLHYRPPSLLAPPRWLSRRRQQWVGDGHCGVILGCAPKAYVGATATALDGRTRLRWDADPLRFLAGSRNAPRGERGMLRPSAVNDCILSASHDFSCVATPWRASGRMGLAPFPPGKDEGGAIPNGSSFHVRRFDLTIATLNDECFEIGTSGRRSHGEITSNRPKVSLSLGYGAPPAGGEALRWMSHSSPSAGSRDLGVDLGDSAEGTIDSSNLKLDVTHDLSMSHSCRGTVEYRNSTQSLSLGTTVTRAFRSSSFSRVGFGVRHAFGNIFRSKEWWKKGTTWWSFQLERGDVRLAVPVTVSPRACTAYDSLTRLFYASLASVVADMLVAELLCGVTSELRLNFLRRLLGKEKVGKPASSATDGDLDGEMEDEARGRRLSEAREAASRQVRLMKRQADAATTKEEGSGGLVIVKAIYGVMDVESRQWIRARGGAKNDAEEEEPHAMDATTQLRFWVTDSSLRLPAASKRHMLGFYDPLAFVGEDEWTVDDSRRRKPDGRKRAWWKGPWRILPRAEARRDLAVVLSVRYRWDGTLYDVAFRDEEAVELPSPFAQEVRAVEKSSEG